MKFREKTTATILIALFMISTLAIAIPVSAQVTYYVATTGNDGKDGSVANPWLTISHALTQVLDTDTIIVTAGTYVEDLVIDKSIELMAAVDEDVTIKYVATSESASGTMPGNIQINADGVKIHGFTIESPTLTSGQVSEGIVIRGSDVEIYENTFVSVGDGTIYVVGTLNKMRTDIDPAVDISGLSIHDNDFTGTIVGGYDAIYINRDVGEGTVTISDNTFTGNAWRCVVTERSHTTISGNSLETTLPGRVSAMSIADYPDPYPDGVAEEQHAVFITGNTITGFREGIRIGGMKGLQPMTNIEVTDNIIQFNDMGVKIRSSAGGITVSNNNILGNTLGVENLDLLNMLNAEYNWWGTGDSALIAGMLTGLVDYDPWLGSSSIPLTGDVTGWELTVGVTEGGTVERSSETPSIGYADGVTVLLTAIPDAGYEFTGWTDSLEGETLNPYTITMDEDKYVSATFFKPIISISLSIVPSPPVELTGKLGTQTPDQFTVTVTNDGNVIVDVTATLTGLNMDFFEDCLMIDEATVSWPYGVESGMIPYAFKAVGLGLDLTGETLPDPGTYSATLVFWAEEPT